jgi:hypothetical protein
MTSYFCVDLEGEEYILLLIIWRLQTNFRDGKGGRKKYHLQTVAGYSMAVEQ